MGLAFAPLGSYVARMRGYLREMFPIPRHAALAVLAALGIAGFTRTAQGVAPAPFAPAAVIGPAWNIFAMLLILRLMDELKDKEIDRRLFPQRPLPCGRVLESDIRASLGAAITLYLLANVHSAAAFVSASVVLGYALLMFKRFFAAELLRRSLPVTLATHTPIVPLIWLQAFVVAAEGWGIPLPALLWRPIGLYVLMLWLAMLGWELSRKIRSAEEESEYVTYSRLLGRAGAVGVAAATQTASALIGVHFYLRFRFDLLYLVILGAGWLACIWGHARFLSQPSPRTSKLGPFAAIFILALLLAQIYGFVPMRT
jgi:4-hydroxybenzoate polyprenyltransferase